MINKRYFLLAASLGLFTACNTPNNTSVEDNDTDSSSIEIEKEETEATYEATPEQLSAINAKRYEIEDLSENITPVELTSDELRAQVKQKWSKIHFYAIDDKLIRVKTYPYTEISERTEEFYFDGNKLILAVIEDNGAGEKGKDPAELDKMYYYENGIFIKEINNSKEKEYTLKDSDAERLLQEAKEYKELFDAQ